MKTLQNNFTTQEQARRLLELGMPKNSADCYYDLDANNPPHANNIPWYLDIPYSELTREFNSRDFLPCWSVGRLVEIMALCYKFDLPDSGYVQTYATDIKKGIVVDVLISDIERFINKIDFSKLED